MANATENTSGDATKQRESQLVRRLYGFIRFVLYRVRTVLRKTNSVRAVLRKTNSLNAERIIRRKLQEMFWASGVVPHTWLRSVIQNLLPIDPLRDHENLPPIDVVIPFVEKDLSVLPLCVAGVFRNVRNPISKLTLVTPADESRKKPIFESPTSHEILTKILTEYPSINLVFDHQVIGEEPLKILRDSGAKGWDIQQILKFAAVSQSKSVATLIVDADTILLSQKTWLIAGGIQVLQVATEFQPRYMDLIAQHFSVNKTLPLSFTTHHQLMQREIVKQMFPFGATSLLEWWEACLKIPGSFLNDYESYGSYIFEKYPHRVVLGTWSNVASPAFADFKSQLQKKDSMPEQLIRDCCSVSFHAYIQVV